MELDREAEEEAGRWGEVVVVVSAPREVMGRVQTTGGWGVLRQVLMWEVAMDRERLREGQGR